MKNIDNYKLILKFLCFLLFFSCNKAGDKTINEKAIIGDTYALKRIGIDFYETYTSFEENKFSDELTIMFLNFVFQIESEQNFDFKNLNVQKDRDNVNATLKINRGDYPLRIVAIQSGNELIADLKTKDLDVFRNKTKSLSSLDELFKWMLTLNFELEIAPDCSFEYKKPSSIKADFIFSDHYTIMYEYDDKTEKIYKEVVSNENKILSGEYIDYE
ncbi:MAG: hypothetical protein ACQESK_04385 [Bacteroidota bacterium]